MIEIIEKSREFTKPEIYLMTISPAMISCKDIEDGTSISVSGYLFFDDVKEDGKRTSLLSIITPEKQVYSCQSDTFKNSLMDIFSIMEGQSFSIKKISGVTKAGRDFINCILDIDNL